MTLALAARPDEDVVGILARAKHLDQRLWHLPAAIERPQDARSRFHAQGVSITSVGTTLAGLQDAVACGGALRVRAVVVDPGARAERGREEAADHLVRALYDTVRGGAPVAVRIGADSGDVLGFTETEWVLSELPRVALWFDPTRALARERAGSGPTVASWVDAFGHRIGGLHVHGLGPAGAGGGHPTDDGADWDALRGAVPAAAPWVLAMDPSHDEAAIRDGLRYLRGLRG